MTAVTTISKGEVINMGLESLQRYHPSLYEELKESGELPMPGNAALIIGATTKGGIGEAIATLFAEEMPVSTPDPQELDVTSYDSVRKYLLANRAYSHVVYCAGVQYLGMLKELDPNEIKDIFDVNIIGYINVVSALSRTQVAGKVCSIGSLAGRVPMRGSIGYCASKAALVHATRCAARELGNNWQITCVVPATVDDTPLTESVDMQVMAIRDWDRKELLEQERIRQPFGRRVHKHEVANVVMSTMMGPATLTGAIIDIAGGA